MFGNKLRELRNNSGLTQEKLAEKIGISANAVGQFERGKILPNYITIANIINTLDIDANLLFSRDSVDCPDEAIWIAKIINELNAEEKQIIGKFFEDIARILLMTYSIKVKQNENSDL